MLQRQLQRQLVSRIALETFDPEPNLTHATLGVGSSFRDKNDPTELHGLYTKMPIVDSWFSPLYQTKSLHKVLPCKADHESVIYVRPSSDKNQGTQAHTGYARYQKPGLVTDYDKPMTLPIQPIDSYWDTSRHTELF